MNYYELYKKQIINKKNSLNEEDYEKYKEQTKARLLKIKTKITEEEYDELISML